MLPFKTKNSLFSKSNKDEALTEKIAGHANSHVVVIVLQGSHIKKITGHKQFKSSSFLCQIAVTCDLPICDFGCRFI